MKLNREDCAIVLRRYLYHMSYYYQINKKFFPGVKIDEFEFFNILKKLNLVKFDENDSYEYFANIFERFHLDPDASKEQLQDLFFILFGMPTRVYEDDEIKDITIEPLFKKYRITKTQAETKTRRSVRGLLYDCEKRTFTLGFKYLDCLNNPNEDNIADLIKHYEYYKKYDGTTKYNK